MTSINGTAANREQTLKAQQLNQTGSISLHHTDSDRLNLMLHVSIQSCIPNSDSKGDIKHQHRIPE